MALESDFSFLQMWPREVFYLCMDGYKKRLASKQIECLSRPGIYVLYRDDEPYYIGRATRLHHRLHSHASKLTGKRYAMWNYFSAYAFKPGTKNLKKRMAEMEGILIAMMPTADNDSSPRWEREQVPQNLREHLKEALGQGLIAKSVGAGRS